jgi:PDZ domain-containing secreted protein
MKTRKAKKTPSNVILTFLSENHEYLPTLENYGDFSIEEEIYRVHLVLTHTASTMNKYKALTKARKVPSISETGLRDLVKFTTQKKYRVRDSPPFSAGPLCGAILKGNDKTLWVSKKRGKSCVWSRVQ